MPIIKRALAVWCLIILAESIHGTLRTLFLAPLVGDFPARQISVFTGAVIIFTITWLTMPWLRRASSIAASTPTTATRSIWWTIGAMWVVLTVIFEISLGRALGLSWQRIVEDYNLAQGGLMAFGLAAMLATPWLVARLKG